MYQKSNVPAGEERMVTIAAIIKDGSNTGLAGRVSAKLINRLEDVLEDIAEYLRKEPVLDDEKSRKGDEK